MRTILAIAIVLGLAGGTWALAQPDKVSPPTPPAPAAPDMGDLPPGVSPEEMKKMMAAMTPGKVHARLASLAGRWAVETTITFPGPQARVETTRGEETVSMMLDGRFVQQVGTGEMMGQPVKNFKMWGYNNGSGRYEGVWAYTMSTGLLHLGGASADDGQTIEWDAWFDNEMGVREEFKVRTTLTDADHFTVEFYGGKMPDGSEGPRMLQRYTRK